jgi:hypothetical protein
VGIAANRAGAKLIQKNSQKISLSVKEKEKYIYKCYLAVTRSKQNKPFKLRKNFDGIEKTQEYPYLNRLSNFFERYPHIKIQDFFEAPYAIYNDTGFLSLQYYLTRPAIKAYSLLQQKKEDVSPDNQIESIRESLHFIGSFCLKNKLSLSDYMNHKTGCIYTWALHYKEHHINIYSLFELGDVQEHLLNIDKDEKELFTNNLQDNLSKFKIRYHASRTAKFFVQEGTKKLNKFLTSCLSS